MGRAHATAAGRLAAFAARAAWPRAVLLLLGLGLAAGSAAGEATVEDAGYLSVTIAAGETIRDVSETYLSDPDLWPEILRASGIASIADVTPGMVLRVPVNEITTANQAVIAALGQIQKANAAGAQIFAPDEIGRAVDLHEDALEHRLARQWDVAQDLAERSFDEATMALEVSGRERDVAAEALITDRRGVVEGQRPEDLAWRDLKLRAILIEEEKVRTLSDSTAQITFRDASRLRLNANSNAIIRQMRFDPLSRREEAKVSLIEGDFYALLAGAEGDRNRLDVEIPEVDAVIDSGDFWVSRAAGQAKFANYDDALVRVAANGGAVTLGRNEGTVVDRGERPLDAFPILPTPEPAGPPNDGVIYAAAQELRWQPVEGAAAYWLEIAADQNFERVVANDFGLTGTARAAGGLPPGAYFWRVSALDGFGLPGARSDVRRFVVRPDETAPFLRIDRPAPGAIVREAQVEVSGESEPDAEVAVDDGLVELGERGRFRTTVTMKPGDNVLTVVATDLAGNATTETRRIVFMPDTDSIVAYDPGIPRLAPTHFLATGDILSLAGTTTAEAEIEIRSADTLRAATVTDGDGVFRVNVPLATGEETFAIAVIAPSGFATEETFAVTVDSEPPAIVLDPPLPWLTAEAAVAVAGATDATARLTLNGTDIANHDGRFEETLTLAPGANRIELIATDPAGNMRVEKAVVRLDRDPPSLVSRESVPTTAAGQSVVTVEVVAEDASGLAKAAPFEVTAGGNSYRGYLRYNKSAKRYRGSVIVPEADAAGARLARVELEDDAGNRQVFEFSD